MHCPHCHNEVMNNDEIRQIIRDELKHLDPDVANAMLTQLTTRLGRSIRAQSFFMGYQTKYSATDANEVVQDEP